jgi:CheY-like chemotaxis protein
MSALRILEEGPEIALLFTDVGLPGMNGRRLVQEARSRLPNLKVLYTTGYARNAIVHHGLLDADVELLPKPFTVETLGRKIRQVLCR